MALLLALTLAPAAGEAQRGVLFGRVRDEFGAPIAGAEIRVNDDKRGLSDEGGEFRIPDVTPGLLYIGARRIGFLPVADLIRYASTDTIDFVLDRIGQRLDTVRVQRRADAAWERDLRRYGLAIDAARLGNVITEQDIANRHPVWTTDLFQTQVGFRTVGVGPTARLVSTRGNCAPLIFLDGLQVPGFSVNDLPVLTIKMIVTYNSMATMPPQLAVPRGNLNCGAVAIFSR
jgi:hypothetical protein